MALVALVALLLPHTSAVCPTVQCADLPPNVCGLQLAEDSFQITAAGCKDTYECRLTDFMDWLAIAELETVAFSCVPGSETNVTATGLVAQTCRQRQYKKDFVGKQAQVLCLSDQDCLLEDGTFTSCLCVPRSDAKGVCQAHPSNQAVFNQYWTECVKLQGQPSMPTILYLYFEAAFQFWVYQQSDLSCIGNFAEIQNLQDLRVSFEWASAAAAAGLLFVF